MEDNLEDTVEFVDPDYSEESERVNPSVVSQVVLNATDWTTETILSQLSRKNIDLTPRFQRRDAWSLARKSKFIESLLLGLPIPQIVLAEKQKQRGRYLVLDGKQRLLTLLQFSGNADGKNNGFKLTGLDVRSDLNNKRFSDLQSDLGLQDDVNAFNNQTIRTVVIRNWEEIEFLHMVFLRLNTSSTALSPQELRQAFFPGEFSNYIDDKATENKELQALLGNKEPDFRMRDVEILVRHIAFQHFLPKYSGNMSAFLDYTCDYLNKHWDEMSPKISNDLSQFDKAINAAKIIFGSGNVGKKWTGQNFEKRLNRAVLDVVLFYFSNPVICEQAVNSDVKVLEAYKNLCTQSIEFRSAIEVTTKSLTAVYDRFYLWGAALKSTIQADFTLPKWDEAQRRISIDGFTD